MEKVYYVTVSVQHGAGAIQFRLYFPSAELRKQFCLTHKEILVRVGRRPIEAGPSDFERTRMNLVFYAQISNFTAIWDAWFDCHA